MFTEDTDWLLWGITAARLLWTGMAVISLLAGVGAWRDAIRDAAALRRRADYRPDGPRAILVRGARRTAKIRLLVQGAFCVLGMLALSVPPSRVVPTQITALLFAGLFLAMEGGLMYDAVQERYDRRAINAKLEQPEHLTWLNTAEIARIIHAETHPPEKEE